jgi:hypothetical protein
MFEDFPNDFMHRQGHKNLVGIHVYHDFPWREVFPSNMTHFRGGKSLARLVNRDCPAGKTPALLLTNKEDVIERGFVTETHYVLPVYIPRYLSQKHAEQADTYFAQGVAVTRPEIQRALQSDPELAKEMVRSHLDIEEIKKWVAGNEENLKSLREITNVQATGESEASIDIESVTSAIDTMKAIDPKLLSALGGLFARVQDSRVQSDLIEALTNDEGGRTAMAQISVIRLPDRISDAQRTLKEYRDLLNNPSAGETDLQRFLEEHPWLFGLDYISVRQKTNICRGQTDFILERYDGTLDILELKGPNDDIIAAPDVDSDGRPPSASAFCICNATSNALAQIHVYKDSFDNDEPALERMYGLKHTRNPRLIVVVGRASALPEHRKRVLEQLNRSLHRVEIVPYDVIADRAEANLASLERLMGIGHEHEEERSNQEIELDEFNDQSAKEIPDMADFDIPEVSDDDIPF